jgi:hypothetical protein
MVHDPSFGTPIEFMSEKQRKALESFRDQLVTILTNNSKLTETEISDLMARETWFTAEQTIENGLADEIISTGRVLNEATTPDQLLALVNSMYNQNKVQKMEQIRNHFGLDAKADETSILNKIKENETLLANAQNKVSELEEEKTELEKEVKEQNDARAVESVENAIKGGLIEESSKEQMIEIAKNNLDTFKTILKSVKRTPVRVTNTVQTNNGGKNVSLREMEKNNPKEVQRILNEEPETYKQMYLDQYGVEPSI